MVLIFRTSRKIGILEICRPMDESSSQLHAALTRKLQTYASLLVALHQNNRWQLKILPWVVGVRGLYSTSSATPVFKFLSIPAAVAPTFLKRQSLNLSKPFTSSSNPVLCHALRPHNQATNAYGSFDTDDPGRNCTTNLVQS